MPNKATNVNPIRMDFSVPPPPLLNRPFLSNPVQSLSNPAQSMMPPNMQLPRPPPNLQQPLRPPGPPIRPIETTSPWTRPVDPVAVTATFGGPSYQLFGGNGPAWSLPPMQRPPTGGIGGTAGSMMQPPSRPPGTSLQQGGQQQQQQNFLFQPGPSALEKLLQQTPKPPQ